MNDSKSILVDCDAGRRMGCATYCCRLIVRLTEEESKRFGGVRTLEKRPEDGYCVYFNACDCTCGIWESRPAVCREYDCNHDRLLQVVLRQGFTTLKNLLTSHPFIRAHEAQSVPYLEPRDKRRDR
ncbi:MAG: hypothetical protein GWN84_07765 [Gammaproteobacteria bacterium]|nr:hypothetical protein [Gammaproteobacteria bacterium]NIR82779.1 hypothetical protein [Gammaproteobacteria bacterium]NIR89643.1 hypothetical protein [Gammaproteobacteria bacterium]NIU03939.1 hypothetical protein [Gammaproteobacteria bacterium]NIV51255.1 hypothetical protein [Gammaproteobacteria bacterium]